MMNWYRLNQLRTKTGLSKAIRFVGVGSYLEVWDEDRYLAECEAAENDEELLDYVNSAYFRPSANGNTL